MDVDLDGGVWICCESNIDGRRPSPLSGHSCVWELVFVSPSGVDVRWVLFRDARRCC